MRKTRIYDCSNSSERPVHREESRGPKENDIMRGLKKYASVFGYEFVDQPADARAIITNDVFPKDILLLDKPKVKRMDGVYWQNNLKERNESLNKAAMEADCTIFISEYSQWSFGKLYQKRPKWPFVITNCVDETVFFPLPKYLRSFKWVASASNWAREEKRYEDLLVFAKEIMSDKQELWIIGQCDDQWADIPNVYKIGYIGDEAEMNRTLNECHAFINLSYKDPAPKVVCQAVNCKLPVLYADSGGTRELVQSGIAIEDPCKIEFEDKTPRLKIENMRTAYNLFMNQYYQAGGLRDQANSRRRIGYMEMLSMYFWAIENVVVDKEIKDYDKNREIVR